MPKLRTYENEDISLLIPKTWFNYLTRTAEERGVTKSELIREALKETYRLEYPDSNKEAAA